MRKKNAISVDETVTRCTSKTVFIACKNNKKRNVKENGKERWPVKSYVPTLLDLLYPSYHATCMSPETGFANHVDLENKLSQSIKFQFGNFMLFSVIRTVSIAPTFRKWFASRSIYLSSFRKRGATGKLIDRSIIWCCEDVSFETSSMLLRRCECVSGAKLWKAILKRTAFKK